MREQENPMQCREHPKEVLNRNTESVASEMILLPASTIKAANADKYRPYPKIYRFFLLRAKIRTFIVAAIR